MCSSVSKEIAVFLAAETFVDALPVALEKFVECTSKFAVKTSID